MDRPDTKADAVIALSTLLASCSEEGDTYLKQHDAPEALLVLSAMLLLITDTKQM